MGQKLSYEERATFAKEIYMLYPGLEQQLEMAFSCHDLQNEGSLTYSTLEPVLRHLLMQYGLIEYVTRFSSTDEDQAEWAAKLRAEQEEQAKEYTRAMREFQERYTQQNALYQQGLKEQQKQISDWNQLLEDAQKTQQQIYEQEMQRAEEKRLKEASAAEDSMREQMELINEYKEKLESIAKTDRSGKCFVYPAAAIPYGACASAGAQEPTRRKRPHHTDRRDRRTCC